VSRAAERKVEQSIVPELLENAVLLCSESKPEKCHRRLVAEYFQKAWSGFEILHL
jgi:hypothetical protein